MRIRVIPLCAVLILAPAVARAQYYSYPSLQPPTAAVREFNFAVASGNRTGTSLISQWRERLGEYSHLQLDAGLTDAEGPGAGARLIIGGGYAYSFRSASSEVPLDMLFTTGIGGSFGNGNSILRIPVGVSLGHRFTFDGASPFAITPYAHPRVSLDFCSSCAPSGRKDTNVGVDVDLGVGVEFTKSMALRASALFAGSDFFPRDNGFGISLVWTPPGLR